MRYLLMNCKKHKKLSFNQKTRSFPLRSDTSGWSCFCHFNLTHPSGPTQTLPHTYSQLYEANEYCATQFWYTPHSVWPDWAIYWTLGNFLKPLATINLPKFSTFLGNFCKRVKIYHFPSEIHSLGNFYRHLAIFSGHTGLITNISGGRMTSINRKK